MGIYCNGVARYLGAQSWQIAILVIVVALAAWALRSRSAHIRYLLWLIVLAKCFVPPLYDVHMNILPERTSAEGSSAIVSPQTVEDISPQPSPQTDFPNPASYDEGVPAAAAHNDLVEPQTAAEVRPITWVRFHIMQVLVVVWIAGVCACLMNNLLRALRGNRRLRNNRRALPSEAQAQIEKLFGGDYPAPMPRIWLLDDTDQPFVWGLLRGSIYLPADFLKGSRQHRQNVLAHEISHVVRFDAAVNLLQIISQAVFWFHPLVWWANRKIRAEREKCCDEMAIARLKSVPKDYCMAIVEVLSNRSRSGYPVPSLAIAGPAAKIEERIKTIMKPGKTFYRRPGRRVAVFLGLVAALTVPTGLALTARARTETGDKKPETLHEAVVAGDIRLAKSFISDGADVNARDRYGSRPIHYAAQNGDKRLTRLLVAKGANITTRNRESLTPLNMAAREGHKELVEFFIARGADIKIKDYGGRTPLCNAAAGGHAEIVELLFAKGADVAARDHRGKIALNEAVMAGSKEIARLLIKAGSEICFPALHMAAFMDDSAKVKELLGQGADIESTDKDGYTPLYFAALGGNAEIVEHLLDKGADFAACKDKWHRPLLHDLAWRGDREMIELLLSKGAEVDMAMLNSSGERRATPLVFAFNHRDVIALLLARGAYVDSLDACGRTPLSRAALQGRVDIAELLLAHGAKINAQHGGTETAPLHWAASFDRVEMIRFLIAKGANLNAADKDGRTPLHRAAVGDKKGTVEILVAKGADIEAKDSAGKTPLHLAAQYGRKEAAEALIANGADLNAQTRENETALDLAEKKERTEIVELLKTALIKPAGNTLRF